MTGLITLEELIVDVDHELDNILGRVNGGKLTLFGHDSRHMQMVPGPIPTPLMATLIDRPGVGVSLQIGVDVYEDDEGEMMCEPRFYWGVVARTVEVEAAWAPATVLTLVPKAETSAEKGRPPKQFTAAMEVLRPLYPVGVLDGATNKDLQDRVDRHLASNPQLGIKSVSIGTIARVRAKLNVTKS